MKGRVTSLFCRDNTSSGINCQFQKLRATHTFYFGFGPGRRSCLRYWRTASLVVNQSRPILTPVISPRRSSRRMKLGVSPLSSEASVTEINLDRRSLMGSIREPPLSLLEFSGTLDEHVDYKSPCSKRGNYVRVPGGLSLEYGQSPRQTSKSSWNVLAACMKGSRHRYNPRCEQGRSPMLATQCAGCECEIQASS